MKERVLMVREFLVTDALIRMGNAYLEEQSPLPELDIETLRSLEFLDLFRLVDGLDARLAHNERRLLLDLLTELTLILECEGIENQRDLERHIKRKIQETGPLGGFLYKLLAHIR